MTAYATLTEAEPALAEHPHNGTLYIQFAESPSAHGGECIRKWSRQPFEGALKFECLTYQAKPQDTDDMSPRLSGAKDLSPVDIRRAV